MTESVPLVARLAVETQPHHRHVDGELERLAQAPSAGAYRGWLARQLGFLAPLESALEASSALAQVIAVRPRRKAPRLRSDLVALGLTPSAITELGVCSAVPSYFDAVPRALGWMYVAERATLSHQQAYRALARSMAGEMAFASSFLKGYDGNAMAMWRAFSSVIDTACDTPQAVAELIAGAQQAFAVVRNYQPTVPAFAVSPAPQAPRATRG